MTGSDEHAPREVPTFSECVLGYREWEIAEHDRLWPLSDHRRPWEPGVNTARCNCDYPNALSFEWNWREGRRVLEPAPQHDAPAEECVCGLYSWRSVQPGWALDPTLVSGQYVCGAVASWGQLQVHHDGVRAHNACITVLAYPPGTHAEAMRVLERVAAQYRVELVPLDELETTASRYASPLPDSIYPDAPVPVADSVPDPLPQRPAPSPQVPTVKRPVRDDRIGLLLFFLCLVPIGIGEILIQGHHHSIVLIGWIVTAAGIVGLGLVVHYFWPSPHRQWRNRRKRSKPALSEDEFRAIEDALDDSRTAREGEIHPRTR